MSKCNIFDFRALFFKTWSSRSECFTSVFYSDGGLGSAEEVSLTLAWEIHNHWSHCWALIRPAVSSLKGQKSIQLHYRADSVVISTHASPLAHTPKQHRNSHFALYVLCVWCLSFTTNVMEKWWVILWYEAFSEEKCNSPPPFFFKKQQTAFSAPGSTLQAPSHELWAYFVLLSFCFFDLLMYYIMFVSRTLPTRI